MGGIRPKTKEMIKRKLRRKAERRRRYHTSLGIPPAANIARQAASQK